MIGYFILSQAISIQLIWHIKVPDQNSLTHQTYDDETKLENNNNLETKHKFIPSKEMDVKIDLNNLQGEMDTKDPTIQTNKRIDFSS